MQVMVFFYIFFVVAMERYSSVMYSSAVFVVSELRCLNANELHSFILILLFFLDSPKAEACQEGSSS